MSRAGNKYIGKKKISATTELDEKTQSGFPLIEVVFEDKSVERFSSLMFDKCVTDKEIDLAELRDLRVKPVVQVVLMALRDWGIKLSELQYFSILLQQSLDFNHSEAIKQLWSAHMPKPIAPDEVDLLTIDKVLKNVK